MTLFALTAPKAEPTAVVVEVPHAGLIIPEPLRDQILVSRTALLRDADLHVDALYADAPQRGATLLAARLSRYVVDLNRAPGDVDRRDLHELPVLPKPQPRGVIWQVTTDGRPTLRTPLAPTLVSERVRSYHAPYHLTLQRTLEAVRERHGFVVLIAGHSMPSVARRGGGLERRADIVPGSLGRSSAHRDVIELIDAHFAAAGLSVRHDEPYRGGFTTAHYGRPGEGVHAVQIEINRALYMDEQTFEPKGADFGRLRELLTRLVARLGELRLANGAG